VLLVFAIFFGAPLVWLVLATTRTDHELLTGPSFAFGSFHNVALPLAKPVVALVSFFSFAADWNNFFQPYVVLPDSAQYPVEVGLSDVLVTASRPMLALAALIAALPVALVFLVCQRALARGLIGDAAGS
jgi:multiple sugar transport system permease protein